MIEAEVKQLFLSNVGFVVLLKGEDDERSLPIFIGAAEAQSIAIWMNQVDVPRPLTHDLFKNVLDKLHCRLQRIEVCDLKDGTFFARLVVRHNGEETEIDARPSDAIALALRFKATIYVARHVMEEAGRIFDADGEETVEGAGGAEGGAKKTAPRQKLTPLESLERDLSTAVEEERYEDAAKLRDEINRLKHTHSDN